MDLAGLYSLYVGYCVCYSDVDPVRIGETSFTDVVIAQGDIALRTIAAPTRGSSTPVMMRLIGVTF